MKRISWLAFFLYSALTALSQDGKKVNVGIITGNLVDSSSLKPIQGATVQVNSSVKEGYKSEIISDKNGSFSFTGLPFGYFRLTITSVGFTILKIDSIHVREERFDFNLSDIHLTVNSKELETVIVYAEKPLIESKDGNITFNAGESALAAGSNASELLSNVPLVSKDPNGKITVRGKEPRILIDDKPVELNMQQLQDLLESMPGSSIEKIEVMTNPPPQYANESGGVINITTRKGKVGKSGRINVSAGTRGEVSTNGNFSYRKQGLSISVNAGIGYNRINGDGYSLRRNEYLDSSNSLKTTNDFRNKNFRPNFRFNLDYDLNKNEAVSLNLNYNQNRFDNYNMTEYRNLNRYGNTYRLSERTILSEGVSYSPN